MTWLLQSKGTIGNIYASQLIIVYMYTKRISYSNTKLACSRAMLNFF